MMWSHYCEVEKTTLEIGAGEPCNWCDKRDPRGIKTTIEQAGQPYVDRPVFAKGNGKVLERAVRLLPVAAALGSVFGTTPREVKVREPNSIRREHLRWVRPDGKGGFEPREA